ncbi:right-handed parallel beta-helix repeat-containing protein [Micromonospora costi]|uniref:Right-handed parallel beta-helix repeat-containing protein n=1 Tax=Micromonospora costi TaxID=1530042 RepID=A0A3B0A4V6_9ACTN|nr:right-handed parallel beta-helix repeat-containing protein [Micromonospora costi]RKN54546.1 right-handed parallel beta-helix repeat-containing protein [Micromonospora costi]
MTRRWALLAVVPVSAAAGLMVPAAPAAVAAPALAAAATSGPELYVSNRDCVPNGDGSVEAPFCTIGAAAAVAGPGQTVLVQPGQYRETVSFSRSGTATAPITFRAVNTPDGSVLVGGTTAVTGTVFSLVGVHDVRVEGFTLSTGDEAPAVVVDGSTGITLDGLALRHAYGPTLLRLTGASRDVTVSRSYLRGYNPFVPGEPLGGALSVDAGVSGAVITANTFTESRLVVTDAPGTVVTGNTFDTNCGEGVVVAGASPGVAIRNNIVQTGTGATADPESCGEYAPDATAVTVSAGSTPETVVDHNLVDPSSGGVLYRWGGTDHTDLASFRAATGQGAHDIVAVPRIERADGYDRNWYTPWPSSPAVDSADAGAPGVVTTDYLGNPHADLPDVPNSGTGTGYHDRGAVEYVGRGGVSGTGIRRRPGGGPTDVVATVTPTYPYRTDGPGGTTAFKFSDDRFWRVGTAREMRHTFRRGGVASVSVWASFVQFSRSYRSVGNVSAGTLSTVVGTHYTPVAPTRVLDTRAAIGVGTTTPVAANSEVLLSLDTIGGVPARDITAVVLNVTVTQPTANGFLTVYPDGTTLPNASNVNFVPRETVPNLVTVPMSNGRIRIRHSGSGTVHVVTDLQGFYGAGGSGYAPLQPTRMLDTREGTGGPFAANGTRQLNLSAKVPAGATAAVLNVTVTRPTANGVLKVFPAGSPVPVASNLNFVTGQTIPNLVTVPVVGGRVSIHNQSSGTTHVVVDLAGWFGPTAAGATQQYVPIGPIRIEDTRIGNYPMGPWATMGTTPVRHRVTDPNAPRASAVVLNLTATGPTAAGVLVAYPDSERPTTSNVNFVKGETAANLAVVKTASDGYFDVWNSSPGTTHFVFDQSGYFVPPAS